MSDSFADLWNSSAPSKRPQPQPQKLGSVNVNKVPKRSQQDVFSLLSSAGSSAPNSRPITPSTASQQRPVPAPRSKPSATSGDAFSGLLGGSLFTDSNGGARMTIAERAAEVERQKMESLRKIQHTVKPEKPQMTSAWDGLDTLAKSTTSLSSKPTDTSAVEDDWGFSTPVSQPAIKPSPINPALPADDNDWLGDFTSVPASQMNAGPRVTRVPPSPPLPETKRPDSPGDFDFGNREDALLDDDSNDEDDILGALSKPVDSQSKHKSPSNQPQPSRTTPSPPQLPSKTNGKSSLRPISPPPHILGQIVEMGFSVQQARIALATTDTGLDVQAALETLISNGAASPQPTPQTHSPLSPVPRTATQSRGTRLLSHDSDTPSPSNSKLDTDLNIQEQADKLLAQASEIGLNVFNKASSFWKEGKEKVQKAYIERTGSTGTTPGVGRNGKPKWMQESPATDAPQKDEPTTSSFSDEISSQRTGPPPQPKRPPKTESKLPTTDLFSNEPTAYISPFRRQKPPQQTALAAPQPQPPARAPSPIRLTQRQNLVSASTSSISRSTKHKDHGAEKFKLGQYGDADAAYTSAIACLPDAHLLLVPLYNNRALARLKTGDHTGAIEDATRVVELIGAEYHPAREAKVSRPEEGAGVDLGDGLIKALKRRAEAWEGREKWEEAGKDWTTVAAADWAKGSVRGEAVRGAGRCRRMVQAASQPEVQPPPKPRVAKPPPSRRSNDPRSQALKNLRAASNAAEAEDQQRHELKDVVDAKLQAWKGGKETNIRALIGSLETVLWPELGLQKVGMADLISPAQVKIRYTKTIAKLHPDKLNTNNTTVEQRMIANGVFGALNEAWNAFKQ